MSELHGGQHALSIYLTVWLTFGRLAKRHCTRLLSACTLRCLPLALAWEVLVGALQEAVMLYVLATEHEQRACRPEELFYPCKSATHSAMQQAGVMVLPKARVRLA